MDVTRADSVNALPQAAAATSTRPTSVRSACERCRTRKIGCPGERPSCAKCVKAGARCEYQNLIADWAYVTSLEDKIRSLESSRSVGTPTPARPPIKQGPLSEVSLDDSPATGPAKRQRTDAGPSTAYSPPSYNDDRTPLDHLGTTPSNQPQFPSNSQLLERLPVGLDLQAIQIQNVDQYPSANSGPDVDLAILPPPHLLSQLIDHFCLYTNAAFPICHAPTLRSQVEALCRGQRGMSSADICIILLVLAVSATSLPRGSALTEQLKPKAQSFYAASQMVTFKHHAAAVQPRNAQRLQVLLLHLQYVLYNPEEGNVWDLTGAAMRAAVDLGLHHEHTNPSMPSPKSPIERDMGRRLFWSAYCIERNLSVALGRPPALADDWITAELPSLAPDELITDQAILPGDPSPLKATCLHHIRIRRLQSEIHNRLYARATEPPTQEWYDSVLVRLREWRDGFPTPTGWASNEWLNLNYHHTLTQLYRPAPGNPSPGRIALVQALESSSSAMRTYQKMYRRGRINYNWLAMYNLFVSGVTYLNSLWQAHRNGWNIVGSLVDALLDVQCCTSVMEALAATTPGTAAIRDAFEAVLEKIIRHLGAHERAVRSSAPGTPRRGLAGLATDTSLDSSAASALAAQQLPDWSFRNQGQEPLLDFELAPANPFDSFFLHPLGDLDDLNWERAVDSVLQPTQDGLFGA